MTRAGRLAGKRAFITGAGSGIGRAVAVRFAQEGANVGLMGRRHSALEQTSKAVVAEGGQALVLAGDVSQEEDVARSVDALMEAWGGLDIVVGVAGVEPSASGDAPVHQLDLSVWHQTIDINLTGMFLTCKHGVRALLGGRGGSVMITGSPCGLLGHCAGQHAYSASKAGTHGLVRVMANDYALRGIRVNCIIPGFIDTPLNAPVFADAKALADVEADIPMKRAGHPHEVAPLYVWLASDEASYVTGAFFTADGGHAAV